MGGVTGVHTGGVGDHAGVGVILLGGSFGVGLATDGAGEGHFAFRSASGFLGDGAFAILVAQGCQGDGLLQAAVGTDAGHDAFLGAGGFLGELPAEDVVLHVEGGGGNGLLGFDVVDLVFAHGVRLQQAVGVGPQLAGVGKHL